MEKRARQEYTDPDRTRYVTMATDQQLFSIFIEDDILQSLLNVHTLLQVVQKPRATGGRWEGWMRGEGEGREEDGGEGGRLMVV